MTKNKLRSTKVAPRNIIRHDWVNWVSNKRGRRSRSRAETASYSRPSLNFSRNCSRHRHRYRPRLRRVTTMMMVFNARIDILRACAQSYCYHKPGFEILFSCLSIMLRLVLNNCYNGTVKFEVREQNLSLTVNGQISVEVTRLKYCRWRNVIQNAGSHNEATTPLLRCNGT